MFVLIIAAPCAFSQTDSVGPPHTSASSTKFSINFNQKMIEGLRSEYDVANVDSVFALVYRALADSVYVFPSENYYYFSFFLAGKNYWGNIRLGVMDRDSGKINFVYWQFEDDPKTPDSKIFSRKMGKAQGLSIECIAPLRYRTSFRGKEVTFQLNDMKQEPPKLFALPPDEDFIFRTCDESGFPFFLIYKKTHQHFMFVLNEEIALPAQLTRVTDSILIDEHGGFAFYLDHACGDRKILIGVRKQNVRRNNYWDGPFDQLADNFIHPKFIDYIQEAYPYTKGRVDSVGIFTDEYASRLAISPYLDYDSVEELLDNFYTCTRQPSDEFLPCLTYDYKTAYNRGGAQDNPMPKKTKKKTGKKTK